MPEKIEPQACFFVSRNKLIFYSENLENTMEIPLSTEVVLDLEIISHNSLERILRNWLDQYKIEPNQIALIMDSSTYFHQTVEQLPQSNDPIIQQFLETVPFSNVLTETFPLQQGAYITALNQNFINPLISILEKVGFIVVSVSPAFIFGIDFNKQPFSKELGAKMLNDPELLSNYSFLSEQEVELKLTTPQPFLSVQFNAKLIVLAMVFIALIGILLALLLMRGVI